MASLVPVSASRHAGKAWRRPASFAFASAQAVVPIVAAEFAKVAVAMPTGFIEQAGLHVAAIGVMSPAPGRNLFVGPAGQWLGAYVPAAFRSYPFSLGRVEVTGEVALCIDEDCGMIVEADGVAEDFFNADGGYSSTIKSMFDFLLAVEHSRAITAMAVTALADAGLIEPWPLQVTIGGEVTPVRGLFRINEGALNALDDAAFVKIRKAGALPLAYMQLLSMGRMSVFEQLNTVQQQLAQAHQQPPKISSLDEIFSRAKNETLRFN